MNVTLSLLEIVDCLETQLHGLVESALRDELNDLVVEGLEARRYPDQSRGDLSSGGGGDRLDFLLLGCSGVQGLTVVRHLIEIKIR
jgi:hypothetical protein